MKLAHVTKNLLSLALVAVGAASHGADARYWTSENDRTVYWLPTLEMRVSVAVLDVGEPDYYGQLCVDIADSLASDEQQLATLKQATPYKSFQRVFAQAQGAWTLEIPSIGKKAPLNPKLGPSNMPYASYLEFLNKAQTEALIQALKAQGNGAVALSGALSVSVPTRNIVDQITLGSDVCRELVPKPDATLFDVMIAFRSISDRIDAMGRLDETRARLKKLVLNDCVALDKALTARSFAELLATPVRRTATQTQITSTTYVTAPTQQSLPVSYSMSYSVTGNEEAAK